MSAAPEGYEEEGADEERTVAQMQDFVKLHKVAFDVVSERLAQLENAGSASPEELAELRRRFLNVFGPCVEALEVYFAGMLAS